LTDQLVDATLQVDGIADQSVTWLAAEGRQVSQKLNRLALVESVTTRLGGGSRFSYDAASIRHRFVFFLFTLFL
jgi:hypothetical protein